MRGGRAGGTSPHLRGAIVVALAWAACVPRALTVASSDNDAGDDGPAVQDDCGVCGDDAPSGSDDADSGGSEGGALMPALSLGPDRPLTLTGGDGGVIKTAHCPSGTFVTRVDSYDDGAHASGIVFYCAQPSLVFGDGSYSVILKQMSSGQSLQPNNAATTFGRMDSCSLKGLSAITRTVGQVDIYVEGLGHHCGTSAVTIEPDAATVFDFQSDGDASFTRWGDGGTKFSLACKSNEVVVGFDVRQGSWLNAIAPICAALDVVYM